MSLYKTIQSHIKEFESNLYTSVPAVVEAYQPEEGTVTVQPSISEIDSDGVERIPPKLERVPILFPSVADSAITFPIKAGDKVILHFCQTNVDNFFTQKKGEFKNVVKPRTFRKHNENDCFATFGFRTYDDTAVKRAGTFDLYFKDSRLTISDNGDIELQLTKTDGDPDNPQVQHTQTLTFSNTGDTSLVYNKDDIDSQVNILTNGEINLKNNKESSSVTMKADGNIAGVTKNTFSMSNSSIELIALLSDLINTLANTTVNTVYGVSPLNSKPQLQSLKTQLDTMKE